MQRTSNIPEHDECNIPGHARRRVVSDIHGRHPHFQPEHRGTSRKNSTSGSTITRKGPVPQARKMRIRCNHNRLPRLHTRARKSCHGPPQSQSHTGLASTANSETNSGIPRIWELLQEIHSRLLSNCSTTNTAHKESREIRMDTKMPGSLRPLESMFHTRTSTQSTRSAQTIPNRM